MDKPMNIERPEWLGLLASDICRLGLTCVVATTHAIGKRILADFEKFGKPEYGSCRMSHVAKLAGCSAADLDSCVKFAR